MPAPATLRLLTGVPIYNGGPDMELVTPTGALLVTAYARAFGPMPRDVHDAQSATAPARAISPGGPTSCACVIGDRVDAPGTASSAGGAGTAPSCKIECEIDDMNPQLFARR